MTPPAPGSWSRWLAIRGDLSLLGVAALLGAIGTVVAVAAGALQPIALVAACVLLAVGVGGLRWTRQTYRALLRQVIVEHAEDDPGPSPVPWIDDRVWRRRNGFDPANDAAQLLTSEVLGHLRPYGHDATGAFTEVQLRPVAPEEREMVPAGEVPPDAPVPEAGDGPELLRRLAASPGRYLALAPRWPVCCERPATLVSLTLHERHPDAAVLGPRPGQTVDPSLHGMHGFQCRACGRRYATDPAW